MQRRPFSRASVATGRCSPASRHGVTLVEVLISLMVISVSVSSVAILFPLSLLRSVQARQLTQATILRYNAENQLDIHPNMFSHMVVGNTGKGIFLEIRPEIFVIDPLGWHHMWEVNTRFRDWIGGRINGLRRFNSGLRNKDNPNIITANQQFLNQARKLVSLPDTWINTARGVPTYVNAPPRLTMPTDVDLSDIPFNASGISRVTVFDSTARFSDVRTITNITDKTITLSSPLSARVLGNNILGEARIEILEQRYTWMLVVRSSLRSADVVVFFRRSFSEEDERIHRDPDSDNPEDQDQTTFFNPVIVKPNGSVVRDARNRPIPNRRILMKWSGGSDNKPFMRRNGFVFDVQNALWYRIHRIEDETDSSAMLVLDDVIRAKGTGGAMLMRGIVEVYPISF